MASPTIDGSLHVTAGKIQNDHIAKSHVSNIAGTAMINNKNAKKGKLKGLISQLNNDADKKSQNSREGSQNKRSAKKMHTNLHPPKRKDRDEPNGRTTHPYKDLSLPRNIPSKSYVSISKEGDLPRSNNLNQEFRAEQRALSQVKTQFNSMQGPSHHCYNRQPDSLVEDILSSTDRDEESAIFNEKPHHKHNDSSVSSQRMRHLNKELPAASYDLENSAVF